MKSGFANAKSVFTLALLEDSGWYKVNYTHADVLKWGYMYGCEFLSTCNPETPPPPQGFCGGGTGEGSGAEVEAGAPPQLQCSFDRSGAGMCVSDGFYMEGCAFVNPFAGGFLCSNWNGRAASMEPLCGGASCKGQMFGDHSSCFQSSLFLEGFDEPDSEVPCEILM